jgi:hypothetical protein
VTTWTGRPDPHGATIAEDAGMAATAHSPGAKGEADFSGFTLS